MPISRYIPPATRFERSLPPPPKAEPAPPIKAVPSVPAPKAAPTPAPKPLPKRPSAPTPKPQPTPQPLPTAPSKPTVITLPNNIAQPKPIPTPSPAPKSAVKTDAPAIYSGNGQKADSAVTSTVNIVINTDNSISKASQAIPKAMDNTNYLSDEQLLKELKSVTGTYIQNNTTQKEYNYSIEVVQAVLKRLGTSIIANGKYTDNTSYALIDFKKANGLMDKSITVTSTNYKDLGKLDSNTLKELVYEFDKKVNGERTLEQSLKRIENTLSVGSRGEETELLQKALSKLGFFDHAVTGYYGTITKASVMSFQKIYNTMVDHQSQKLEENGTATVQTLKAIARVLEDNSFTFNGAPASSTTAQFVSLKNELQSFLNKYSNVQIDISKCSENDFKFKNSVKFYLNWFDSQNIGLSLNSAYKAVSNEYKAEALKHWLSMTNNNFSKSAFIDSLMPTDYINRIPDAPVSDSQGMITNENKYDSQEAKDYYYKNLYVYDAINDPTGYAKEASFKSWARHTYGSSKDEQNSEFWTGALSGLAMSPMNLVAESIEGIYSFVKNKQYKDIGPFVQFMGKAVVSKEYRQAFATMIDQTITEWKSTYNNSDSFEKGRIIGDLIGKTVEAAVGVGGAVKSAKAFKEFVTSGGFRNAVRDSLRVASEAIDKLKYTLKYSIDELASQVKRVVSIGDETVVDLGNGITYAIRELEDIPEASRPAYREVIQGIWKYSGKTADEIADFYISKVADKTKVSGKFAGSPSEILRAELKDAGVIPPPYKNQVHHIIPEGETRYPAAVEARQIIERYGVDVNSACNGVFLPDSPNYAHAGNAAVHKGSHTDAYYKYIRDELINANVQSADDVADVLDSIRRDLLSGIISPNM